MAVQVQERSGRKQSRAFVPVIEGMIPGDADTQQGREPKEGALWRIRPEIAWPVE